MKVVIVGAGNVATVFGRLIQRAGHQILQVMNRSEDNARQLAAELGCGYALDPAGLLLNADIYLLAMADAALDQVQGRYALGDRLVVHTAGSVSMHNLRGVSSRYGVIYPLQSLRKEQPLSSQHIPLLIGGNTPASLLTITAFAASLSGMVQAVSDEERLKLHVAAVVVSNFTNHLYVLAERYCMRERLDFTMLQPLIEETAMRLREYAPSMMQTGPAIRKDNITINKHLEVLETYPELHNIYRQMTESIRKHS